MLAVPAEGDDVVYISSGTWSLMGVERREPDCSPESMKADFTNEGGYDHRYRYLRNIMGLWMIQSVKKEFEEELSFAQICERAEQEPVSYTHLFILNKTYFGRYFYAVGGNCLLYTSRCV